jgi:hypothetical protein
MLDSERAAILGRLGAARLHSVRDARETTANARAAFMTRFAEADDPESAKSDYFRQLGRRSACARSRCRKLDRCSTDVAS